MAKQPITDLESCVTFGDLIVLELPASVQTCVSFHGSDYAAGFYSHSDEENVYLNTFQKSAYDADEPKTYVKTDIESFEVLKKYVPDPNDGIDEVLTQLLDIPMNYGDED